MKELIPGTIVKINELKNTKGDALPTHLNRFTFEVVKIDDNGGAPLVRVMVVENPAFTMRHKKIDLTPQERYGEKSSEVCIDGIVDTVTHTTQSPCDDYVPMSILIKYEKNELVGTEYTFCKELFSDDRISNESIIQDKTMRLIFRFFNYSSSEITELKKSTTAFTLLYSAHGYSFYSSSNTYYLSDGKIKFCKSVSGNEPIYAVKDGYAVYLCDIRNISELKSACKKTIDEFFDGTTFLNRCRNKQDGENK